MGYYFLLQEILPLRYQTHISCTGRWILYHWAKSKAQIIAMVHPRVFSCVQLFVIIWMIAHQVPLSMGFSRQECWSGLPFLPPRNLPDPGIEPHLLHWQADYLPLSHLGSPIIAIGSLNTNTPIYDKVTIQTLREKDVLLVSRKFLVA